MYRLRRRDTAIGIAHLCPGNQPALDDKTRTHTEERRLPQHQIGKFAGLDRTDMGGDAVADGRIDGVLGTRTIGKKDMKLNDALPRMQVDPETYEVRADGELLTCEPAHELPLAQRYFLF